VAAVELAEQLVWVKPVDLEAALQCQAQADMVFLDKDSAVAEQQADVLAEAALAHRVLLVLQLAAPAAVED